MIDLHLHSTASDGTCTPRQVAQAASAAGCRTIALCDHDTVDGLSSCHAACQEEGLSFVPGVELSTGGQQELHVLGYGVAAEKIAPHLRARKDDRQLRMEEMLRRAQEAGMDISLADVEAMAGSAPLGRPHIALCMVQKGYASSVKNAFDRYLGTGRPLYVPRRVLSFAQTAELLHHCDGCAVIAHPVLISTPRRMLTQLLSTLIDQGADGIEVYHSSHTPSDAEEFLSFARRHRLLVTGGSDFHGKSKPVAIGQGLSRWHSAEEDLHALGEFLRRA